MEIVCISVQTDSFVLIVYYLLFTVFIVGRVYSWEKYVSWRRQTVLWGRKQCTAVLYGKWKMGDCRKAQRKDGWLSELQMGGERNKDKPG